MYNWNIFSENSVWPLIHDAREDRIMEVRDSRIEPLKARG